MAIATEAQAIEEWTRNVGYEDCYKDRQWICSNYDTWERNPYYRGPEQPHPEAAYDDYLFEREWIDWEITNLKNHVEFSDLCPCDCKPLPVAIDHDEIPF